MKLQGVVVAGFLCGAMLVATERSTAQETKQASVDSSGKEGNGLSLHPSSSADGRFVAFQSNSSTLVSADTNSTYDVFMHDRSGGLTTLVSADSSNVQGNGGSLAPSMSTDGRFVAFESSASNLVTGDTNGTLDVFVRDLASGTTDRVSVDSSGVEANNLSGSASISADGRFVAFQSFASNLVAGDTNATWDVFVHDRSTGSTERVSVDSSGSQGNGESHFPWISADGRFVAFESFATNLVAGDTNATWDIFVHDRSTGSTERVSVSSAGAEGVGASQRASTSADGRFVVFESLAANLVSGDTNGHADVFVHDRSAASTELVSVASSGAQGNDQSRVGSISADGRFVAFESAASNLVAGDTNGWTDVFLHDRSSGRTRRVSVDSSGAQGDNSSGYDVSISGDGRFVAFDSFASNLVSGDTNHNEDVFVHGAYLTLDAQPDAVKAGDTLALTSFTGAPSRPLVFALVDLNGTPTFVVVILATFDVNGVWNLVTTVPPGLSGLVATFETIGFVVTGKAVASNAEVITFQ